MLGIPVPQSDLLADEDTHRCLPLKGFQGSPKPTSAGWSYLLAHHFEDWGVFSQNPNGDGVCHSLPLQRRSNSKNVDRNFEPTFVSGEVSNLRRLHKFDPQLMAELQITVDWSRLVHLVRRRTSFCISGVESSMDVGRNRPRQRKLELQLSKSECKLANFAAGIWPWMVLLRRNPVLFRL